MFRFALTPRTEEHDGVLFYRGSVRLGAFEEEFLAAAVHWTPDRYERQWRAAARRLVGGAQVAVFITSFVHPDAVAHLWAAWRSGSVVHVQNLLSVPENRGGILDPDAPEVSVGPRRIVSDDGEAISEWSVPLADVAAFAV